MKLPRSIAPWVALIVIALCAAVPLPARAQPMHDLPVYVDSVEKAVSAENLRAVAATTEDPEVLLGLSYLVRPGDPLRAELAERAIQAKPAYAAPAAVIAVTMDGPNEQNVAALLERDPENALGHYLSGFLLYTAKKDAEAFASFKQASALREFRLYLEETSSALFKALDALGLQGRERLAALSWMATRAANFGIMSLQEMPSAVGSTALQSGAGHDEVGNMLLVLAGHLALTNFEYREHGHRALMIAFRRKAEMASADGSPAMYGYASATQALISAYWGMGEFEEGREAREAAQFLPSRIHLAFVRTGPHEAELYNVKRDVPEADRPAFERAREAARSAAAALIAEAEKAPDEIMGAYLRGMPPPPENALMPWVPQWTYVDRAMERHPAVYEAAVKLDEADQALSAAGANDPKQLNLSNLLHIGNGAIAWAQRNENTYPPSLDALVEKGWLKEEATKSVHTGRPYVFIAAGQPMPEGRDFDSFIVAYDDHELEGGYQVVWAMGGAGTLPAEQFREHLKSRGLEGP